MNSSEFQQELAGLRTDAGRSEYRIEGTSKEPLVVTEPVALRGILFDQPVIIRHVIFQEFVDFSEWRCAASLRIEDCEFKSGLRLADTHVEGLCSLKQCSFDDYQRGWLDFRRMQIGGLLNASNITSKVCIDMANMKTGDDAWFSGASLTAMLRTCDNLDPNNPRIDDALLTDTQANWKEDAECKVNTKYLQDQALHLGGASIGRNLFFYDRSGRTVAITGQVTLPAKVNGDVQIGNAKITATKSTKAVDMVSATVGGSVFIHEGTEITGQVDLRAKVTGDVQISNAKITATESIMAVDMVSATVGGSVFIREGTEITGQVDLRAKVTGNVEISNASITATKSTKAVNMNGATVCWSVFIDEGAKITGYVDLRAKVTTDVVISNAKIMTEKSPMAVNMVDATVGGSVFIREKTEIIGEVNLRAKVTGNIEIRNATITAPESTIANATITAPESTIAVNMKAATIGGVLIIVEQARIGGGILLFGATLGGLHVTSNASEEKFEIPQEESKTTQRTALIQGQFNLTYATIHGPCQIHHLSHFGDFIARHLTVHGDFDICGSIVGTTKNETQSKWLDEEFKKPVPTTTWSSEETVQRISPVQKQKTVNLEMAEIHGRCWLKGTRVLGNIYFEDAEIDGEANFDEGEVYGDLQLRSSIIKGRVFADEKSSATSYPRVTGEIDLSYANVQQVDIKLEDGALGSLAFRHNTINLTNATIDTFSLKGKADCDSDLAIITDQSTIQTMQFDNKNQLEVVNKPPMFKGSDYFRAFLFTILVLVIFYLFSSNFSVFPFSVFLVFVVYYSALWCRHHYRLKTKPVAIPILDHLHLTKPFSRGYYVMVEQRLRSKGNDDHADEVFLMRRKREQNREKKKPKQENNSGVFRLWSSRLWSHFLDFIIRRKFPKSRQETLWSSRLWSLFLDFIMGYGVRMHRILIIYLLMGFLNWAVFLDKNSVERPIVFVQNRTDGPAWGNADGEPGSDPKKMVRNVWPSDGGRAVGPDEWDAKHAFFLAMRLQIPIIQLVTENDWTPATRPMEHPLFRWTGISYADFASVTMVLNLLLIPLLVTGLTGYNKKL